MSVAPRRVTLVALALTIAVLALPGAALATFPGTNGVVSFTAVSSPGEIDVWTANADGSDPGALLGGTDFDYAASWSPDGTKLAFLKRVAGVDQIWTADANGENQDMVLDPSTSTLFPASVQQPVTWSPDGTKLLFANQRGIHTIPATGGAITTIVSSSSPLGDLYFDPQYSPDGTQIAFAHLVDENADSRIEILDVADATTRHAVTAVADGVRDGQPDWSPDGSKLLFLRFVNGVSADIEEIDAPFVPGTEQPVTPAGVTRTSWATWSPDGTQIAFLWESSNIFTFHGIQVMNADGSNLHGISPAAFGDSVNAPRWQTLPQPVPVISLSKTGPSSADAGTAVPFTLTVGNPGSVPLTTVDVTDPLCDSTPALPSKNGDTSPDSLDPGEEWTYGCSVTTSLGDATLHNVATATGSAAVGAPVSDSDAADVLLVNTFGGSGGTASTGGDVTPTDPAGAALTTPVASSITIVTSSPAGDPSGFQYVGSQFVIDATDPADNQLVTSPTNPLRLVFTVDASVLTAVGGIDNLEAFRDNAVIQPCSQADGTANPDPCVAGRTVDPGTGDGKITILSTHASKWNLGKSTLAPYAFDGYKAPIRPGLNKLNPGSEQPMKFRLGGNLGLGILAAGYPVIQPIDCTTLLPTGSSFGARGTLSYDRKADTYTYTWKSPKVLPQCVELNVKTLDGVSHPALFKTH